MNQENEIIIGRNSVLEAIKSGRSINKIIIAEGKQQGSVLEIIAKAKELGLIVQKTGSAKLDQMAQGARHQGIIALTAPVRYAELEEILARAKNLSQLPFLVLLDEISDPHNLGAILRTADAAGAHGVLIPKRRSCPLTQTVAKTSAGALEYVPVARIGNVVNTLKLLKNSGLWVIGADAAAQDVYCQADFNRPVVVVIGSEGKGLSRLTKENCDFLVRIPMAGSVNSLNASVACSLLLYEALRQRQGNNL